MAIRIKLDQTLFDILKLKLRAHPSDVLSLVKLAFEEQGSFDNIHEAVKNGTKYLSKNGISTCPGLTQIVDMNDTLYLLTNRLMEVDKLVEFDKLTENTYQILNNLWE